MDEVTAELYRMRMSVAAIRERLIQDLNAMEAQIEQFLPKEQPQNPKKYDLKTVRSWANHSPGKR